MGKGFVLISEDLMLLIFKVWGKKEMVKKKTDQSWTNPFKCKIQQNVCAINVTKIKVSIPWKQEMRPDALKESASPAGLGVNVDEYKTWHYINIVQQ